MMAVDRIKNGLEAGFSRASIIKDDCRTTKADPEKLELFVELSIEAGLDEAKAIHKSFLYCLDISMLSKEEIKRGFNAQSLSIEQIEGKAKDANKAE
ncbi:MAG: hypothetical protein FWE48_03605 [Coriobacteriia bacterium]|nr:hypothetical protein [Coriobacteriia bacterium]